MANEYSYKYDLTFNELFEKDIKKIIALNSSFDNITSDTDTEYYNTSYYIDPKNTDRRLTFYLCPMDKGIAMVSLYINNQQLSFVRFSDLTRISFSKNKVQFFMQNYDDSDRLVIECNTDEKTIEVNCII